MHGSISSQDVPVAVLGAGPHGLAAVAYLRAAGVETRVFGEPMQFWREHMPIGMLLRSSLRASSIASPGRNLTIERWAAEHGREAARPVPLADFLEYGEWYQRQVAGDVDRRRVARVARSNGSFELALDDGDALKAGRVVVAAGIAAFPRVPALLRDLPPALASHAVDHDDLSGFAGQRVTVFGSGQSALESAALLHEVGADVDLAARSPSVYWLAGPPTRRGPHWPTAPTDVGGRVTSWLAAAPDVFRRLPRRWQPPLAYRCIRPAGAHWLRERLEGVEMRMPVDLTAARPVDGRLELEWSDGTRTTVDHVLLGTGYEIDVRRYPFLDPALANAIELAGGYPRLGPGLESSVACLHFVGAPAAYSFGPVMRFVTGTWYDAPALAARVSGRRQPLVRWSF